MTGRRLLLLRASALTGALAVIVGAFGAHALKDSLDAAGRATYETGVLYLFLHTLAALGCALLPEGTKRARAAGFTLLGGGIAFAAAVLLTLVSPKVFGPIAPLGGTAMIVGWILLATVRPEPLPGSGDPV